MEEIKLKICNMALALLGVNTIKNINDTSKEANACKIFYENCKNKLLLRHTWSFAIKKTVLYNNLIHNYNITLPKDLIKILKVYKKPSYNYTLENSILITNDTNPEILYLSSSEELFTTESLFIDSFIYILASDIAIYLIDNSNLALNLLNIGEKKLIIAINVDINNIRDSISDTKIRSFYYQIGE